MTVTHTSTQKLRIDLLSRLLQQIQRQHIQHIAVMWLSFFLTLGTGNLAYGDDTEIFFNSRDPSANVLFLIDSSGSMSEPISQGSTRLDALKQSFSELINNSKNMNVGIMSFTLRGGSVIQPFINLDDTYNNTQFPLTILAGQRGNTAQQSLKAESSPIAPPPELGAIFNNNRVYSLSTEMGSLGFDRGSIALQNAQFKIQNTNDFQSIYQDGLGTWRYANPSILLGSNSLTGLRFNNVNIPAGARIISAQITFTGDLQFFTNPDILKLQIRGSTNMNPPSFSNSFPVEAQLQQAWQNESTNADQHWAISEPFLPNETYDSSDISHIIQEIVNNKNWTNKRALVLMLKHTDGMGSRIATGINPFFASSPPRLSITWINDSKKYPIMTGLHFDKVNVPQGATIASAYLTFHANRNESGNISLHIAGHKSGHSPRFPGGAQLSSTNGVGPLAKRTRTASKVSWDINSDWKNNQLYKSPDITPILQELVNRKDWCGGNDISLLLYPNALSQQNNRHFIASEHASELYPELHITYTYDKNTRGKGKSTQPSGCIARKITYQIAADSDDVEENFFKQIILNYPFLTFNNGNTIALRFTNIDLKANTKLFDATLNVTATNRATTNTELSIQIEDSSNSAPILWATGQINNRSTYGNVKWTINEPWEAGGTYSTSIDLKPLIHHVIQKADWQPGNAITLIIHKTRGADRSILTRENSTRLAASLSLTAKEADFIRDFNFHNRDILTKRIESLSAKGATPIAGMYYEAARYFRGDTVDWGSSRLNGVTQTDPLWLPYSSIAQHQQVSHPDSWQGGTLTPADCTGSSDPRCIPERITGTATYRSPIKNSCQSNHIVILTDGEANSHYAPEKMDILMGGNTNCYHDSIVPDEMCMRTLASYLRDNNQIANIENSHISTHSVAYNLLKHSSSYSLLEDLAERGGGYFHSAQNAAQLRNAFGNIISKIQQLSATITQPSINVNQFNRLYHRNNVYYSLFSTSGKPNWEGNIKGYALKAQPDGAVRVVDVNGQAALDPNTNFFKSNAKSYWSKSADGKDVTKGGVLENLPNPSNRTLFTYLHHTLADPTKHKKALRAPQNALDVSNTTLRFDTMFGAADLQQMQQIIQWVKGVDILDEDHDGDKQEPRSALADSLHSSPIPVTYGGTPTQPDEVIFVGSNDGSLRAFDAQSGSEMWGFIPEELLPLQRQLFENNNVFHHSYGIDNTPVVWIDDNNHDGIIQPNTDRIMLYLTMRRGGRNVYALDITDKNNPRMKWVIRGGLGDYLNLGQTWSQPVLTSIQLANHAPQKVLILAGGYDPQHDIDINNMPDSSTGNALYIIDALTGKRITYASKSIDSSAVGLAMADMKHAFPATVNILDHNLDGLVDQIYVPDIAGDLWRFDITHQVNSASDLLHGGIIAHLGGDASTGGPRRFFAKPDLSLLPSGGRVTLTIGLGSGEATSPLNQTIQNRYYAITQPSSFLKPSKYQAIDEQDLTDISNGLQAEEALARGGWYLSLNQGEKVISSQSGTTFNQVGFFTTYSPITSASANANTANTTASSCTNIPTSTARLYAIDMRTGQSALDLNHDGQLNHSDRAVQLKTSAIPAAPSLLLLENVDHPVILVGTETPLEDMMASNPNLSSKNQEWKRIYWENHH